MHIVEIRRAGDSLAGPMAAIRTWLDAHSVEPKLFQCSVIAENVVFRMEFESASEAAAIARAFDGHVADDRGSIAA